MCKMLLSINPNHVENIFNGVKKYEYRKIKCKKNVEKILIYSTSPVQRIVGEATIELVIEDSPSNIWKLTEKFSGINKNFYEEYYSGKEIAVAYKLCDIIKYETPKKLEVYGIKMPPQSFMYV